MLTFLHCSSNRKSLHNVKYINVLVLPGRRVANQPVTWENSFTRKSTRENCRLHCLSITIPCNAGELEKAEKIEQVTECSYTPLRIDSNKPERNHKEC